MVCASVVKNYYTEAAFPSEIDDYDFIYFRTIFKLLMVLPHVIRETDFENYLVDVGSNE